MKTNFSRAQLALYYARTQKGIHSLSQKDLFNILNESSDYWDKLIPDKIHKQRNNILKDNGFTQKQWEEILRHSHSVFFLPTKEIDKCNKEIRTLIKTKTISPNGSYYSMSVFSGNLFGSVKRSTLNRTKINGRYEYHLTNEIFEAIETRIKTLYS